MVLSSGEHQEILESVAAQCSARFSLLPFVTSMSPKTESQEHSQNGKASMISNLAAEVEKFPIKEGNADCISSTSSTVLTGKCWHISVSNLLILFYLICLLLISHQLAPLNLGLKFLIW